jgi:hypothetical protein
MKPIRREAVAMFLKALIQDSHGGANKYEIYSKYPIYTASSL